MPALADLQQRFADAVLGAPVDLREMPEFVGRLAPSAVIGIHQATVAAALVRALKITYPTVEHLVGIVFFEHAAEAFVATSRPVAADLGRYGEAFPRFLQGFEPAASLNYLCDSARLDWAVSRAQRAESSQLRRVALASDVALDLPQSLAVLSLEFPADEIRALVEAGDDEALGQLDMRPTARFLAIWRGPQGVAVRQLNPIPGVFLASLLEGASLDEALISAVGEGELESVLPQIQTDVFAASFSNIIAIED